MYLQEITCKLQRHKHLRKVAAPVYHSGVTLGVYIPKERQRMKRHCAYNTSRSQPGKSGYAGAVKQQAKFKLYLKNGKVLIT